MSTPIASIIIPTYKRPKFLAQAIKSAVEQDIEEPYEIIVVSDGDSDAGLVCSQFDGIKYMCLSENRGVSSAVNVGFDEAQGEFVTILQDDDLMKPNKLIELVKFLRDSDNAQCGMVCALSRLINEYGDEAKGNGDRYRKYWMLGLKGITFSEMMQRNMIDGASTMYRHSMIEDIGGWDESLLHAEEYEFHLRALHNGYQVGFVGHVVADYRVHEKNKSLFEGRLIREVKDTADAIRLIYRAGVTVSMATIPERLGPCRQAVKTLLPQCDRLNVYLHGHFRLPPFLKHPKIEVMLERDYGDLQSIDKFRWADRVKGYHFLCDDDLLYPLNYVQHMIDKIEQYDRKAVVGCHGSILRFPLNHYYRDRQVMHFREHVAEDTRVHVLGTGVSAYHHSTLDISIYDFSHEVCASDDVWFALAAQLQRVPLYVIAHKANWVRQNPRGDTAARSIYQRRRNNCQDETDAINTLEHWSLECCEV